MSKQGATYQETLVVKQEHLDAIKHVNNVVYVQWINDISENHWQSITNAQVEASYFWVVLKHDIDYLGEAFLGDELIIKTKVGETAGAKSIREIYIYKQDTLIVQSKTTWCLINRSTLKPSRIGADVLNVLFVES